MGVGRGFSVLTLNLWQNNTFLFFPNSKLTFYILLQIKIKRSFRNKQWTNSYTRNKNLPHESKLAEITKISKNYIYVKRKIQRVVTIHILFYKKITFWHILGWDFLALFIFNKFRINKLRNIKFYRHKKIQLNL